FGFCLRLNGRNPWLKPAHGTNGHTHALCGVVAESVGNPDVRRGKYLSLGRKVQLEVRLEHADDDRRRCLWSADRHGASEHGGISTIASLEVLIAEDCVDRQPRRTRSLLLRARRRCGRVRDGVVVIEVAAVRDASTEKAEKVDSHYRSVGLLGRSVLALKRQWESEDTRK